MIKRKILLPFLWIAACCMLLAIIMPHHHHLDGRVCLHLTETPENSKPKDITHQSDCETDCITRIIAYRTSMGTTDFQPNLFIALPGKTIAFDFSPEIFLKFSYTSQYPEPDLPAYCGSVTGLRAPPCLV